MTWFRQYMQTSHICPTCTKHLRSIMVVPDGVVEGLDLAVMKHNEGEALEVSVAPEYGFGDREERRALATVPASSQLHYAVEILEVQKVRASCGRPDMKWAPCMGFSAGLSQASLATAWNTTISAKSGYMSTWQ